MSADKHVQIAGFQLLVRGIDDKFSIYSANPAGAGRPQKRNLTYGKRRTCTYYRGDIRVVFAVGAQDVCYNLDLLEIAIGE